MPVTMNSRIQFIKPVIPADEVNAANMKKHACWIWMRNEKANILNIYAAMRLRFNLSVLPEKAPLWISAANVYRLWINGRYVCRGPSREWRGKLGIDGVDIVSFLQSGVNIISVQVHCYGEDTNGYPGSCPGFFCYGNAGKVCLHTGRAPWFGQLLSCWDAGAERMHAEYGRFNEIVNMDQYHPQVWEKGFDNGKWIHTQPVSNKFLNKSEFIPRSVLFSEEKNISCGIISACAEIEKIPVKSGRPPAEQKDSPAHLCLKAGNGIVISEALRMMHRPRKKLSIQNYTNLSGKITAGAGKPVSFIYDMSRMYSGVLQFTMYSKCSIELKIGYGDRLLIKGKPQAPEKNKSEVSLQRRFLETINADHGKYNNSVDTFRLKSGINRWEGSFVVRGFRYVQFDFEQRDYPVQISRLGVREIAYPDVSEAAFTCSDDLLNRIWDASLRTLRQNMAETYLDNPSRERQQYGGDGRIQALCGASCFREYALWKQYLRHMAEGIGKDNAMQCGGPWPWNQIIPGWTLHWIESIREYIEWTADLSVLKTMLIPVRNALEWISRFETAGGMLAMKHRYLERTPKPRTVWNFTDWQLFDGELPAQPSLLVLNCLYCSALKTASDLHASAGDRTHSDFFYKKWMKTQNTVLSEIRRDPVSAEKSEHAAAAASLAGLGTGYITQAARRASSRGWTSDVLYAFFTLAALEKAGLAEDGLSLIKYITGPMLETGYNTFFETRQAFSNPQKALCQGVAGFSAHFLPRFAGGVQVLSGLHKTVRFTPGVPGLTGASCRIPVPGGYINAGWKRSGLKVKSEITLPEGWRCVNTH